MKTNYHFYHAGILLLSIMALFLAEPEKQISEDPKFEVHTNGGVSIGTFDTPPEDGLIVKDSLIVGHMLLTDNGSTLQINHPKKIEFIVGNNKISIDQARVSIEAPFINVKAGATLSLDGPIIKLNNGSRFAAGFGDNVVAGTILSGSQTVLIP